MERRGFLKLASLLPFAGAIAPAPASFSGELVVGRAVDFVHPAAMAPKKLELAIEADDSRLRDAISRLDRSCFSGILPPELTLDVDQQLREHGLVEMDR